MLLWTPAYILWTKWVLNMDFKLGFGPMSYEVIDILTSYAKSNQRPLMLIASRNQVDVNSGYVTTTKGLAKSISPNVSEYLMVCRDHCGPYFLDQEKSLTLPQAIKATKLTIEADIENGFDLIHIDTSRCDQPYQVADELFNFCLRLNPKVKFEFGTEENVGVTASIKNYQNDVKFAGQFPNMEFVVAQTGSLTMEDRQVGSFDIAMVKKLVGYAERFGVKLKEHNADYLTSDQILMRKQSGVHACNIAPQLGVIQTKLLLSMCSDLGINSVDFQQKVLNSQRWKKWIVDGDDSVKVCIAGHYCFNSIEYKELIKSIGYEKFYDKLREEISHCMDLYYSNLC